MYGVAWTIVVGVLAVLGLVVALTVLAAPLFGLIVLILFALGALVFFVGRRERIGTEKERAADRRAGGDGAPISGEGGQPTSGEGYEAV